LNGTQTLTNKVVVLNGSTVNSVGLGLNGNASFNNNAFLTGLSLNFAQTTYTDTVSSGSVPDLYDVSFGRRVMSATNAVTYQNAATVHILGNCLAGTNVTFANNDALKISQGNIRLSSGRVLSTSLGSAAAPVYSTGASLNDGVYGAGVGAVGFTTSGVLRVDINAARLNSAVPIYLPNGSVTAPSLTFTNDTGNNSGFYFIANDVFGLSINGNNMQTYQSTGVTSNGISTLSGGVKVGGTAFTTMTQQQFGNLTIVAPNIGATTNITAVITFATAFSSAPQITLTSFPVTGSTGFNRVILSVASSTTTNATINIYNSASGGGAQTSGDVVIQWIAYV
jgi:hypothetical protein